MFLTTKLIYFEMEGVYEQFLNRHKPK